MNRTFASMVLLWLLYLPNGALGAGAGEFAYGRPIDLTSEATLQRLRLPQDVYEWVTRSDLGDLRVFNGADEEVPYQILRPQRQEDFTTWVALPLFALPVAENAQSTSRVDIKLDDRGTVVAVDGGGAGAVDYAAFLLDASALERPISQLQLDWEPAGFVGQVRLEASDDLNEWRLLADSATLAELRSQGAQIRKDILEFGPTHAAYLRLTQLDNGGRLQLTGVRARSRETHLPPRSWKTLAPQAADGGFEYATGGLFPLDRVTVVADATSYLFQAELLSRARPEQPWESRGRYTFYATQVNEQPLAALPLRVRSHQHWRVELEDDEAAVRPLLRVGWRPDEVIFIPQGPQPMQLAYGRAATEGRPWPIAELLTQSGAPPELDRAPLVGLGDAVLLGGVDVRLPSRGVDWETVLLWLVLVVGVGIVGTLAYRLVKSSA